MDAQQQADRLTAPGLAANITLSWWSELLDQTDRRKKNLVDKVGFQSPHVRYYINAAHSVMIMVGPI